VIFRYFLVLGN